MKGNARERLIVAMDVSDMAKLIQTVDLLSERVVYYKIGMESFYRFGNSAIELMVSKNKKVFLDLKLHDIPNTVAQSVKALCRLAPEMLTIHASGGPTMLKAAVAAADEEALRLGIKRPKLLGITVLTSLGEAEWSQLGNPSPIRDSVLRFASISQAAGMDGVVSSPLEAADLRRICGPDFLIVTPGVRPADSGSGDQNRIMTPGQALRNGADYLVIGRPILAAVDPCRATEEIVKEMEGQAND